MSDAEIVRARLGLDPDAPCHYEDKFPSTPPHTFGEAHLGTDEYAAQREAVAALDRLESQNQALQEDLLDERIVGMDSAEVTLTPVTASDHESALREVRRILEAGLHGRVRRPAGSDPIDEGHLVPGHAEMHCLLWDALDVANTALKEETAWTQPDPALGERNEYKEEHE